LTHIFPWLKRGRNLGVAYTNAKFAREENEAQKLVAEAAEIAARTDIMRQQEAREFNALVNDIFADNGLPWTAKKLKFSKLIENNPEIIKQMEKVNYLIEKLAMEKELNIGISREPNVSNQEKLDQSEMGKKGIIELWNTKKTTRDSEKDKQITTD